MLKPLEDLGTDKIINNSFITMDIETIKLNNQLVPYLICAYNGIDYINSFGDNLQELFSHFINNLLSFFKDNNRTLTVFAHNFASFDGVFILKHLIPFGIVEPLYFNGKLITIKLKITIEGDHTGKTIIFKDSFLLLPVSLRKLALIYNCTEIKGIFPFLLSNILYSGTFPRFEYFTDVNIDTYLINSQEYSNKIWNFKEEAIKYCKLDCLILHEILIKFNELIFNEFKVNVHKVLTLPSLAMRIFKSLFMPIDSIFQLHGGIEKDIRQSYTGGAVDVYIPHNRLTPWLTNEKVEYETLYYYDVNGLYPTVMSQQYMPVGKPIVFEGEITKINPQAFGFFYCEITSPQYLDHPILQRRIKTSNGIRTIAGLGTWTDWIFSEEMYNAIKFGYTFKIIKGYEFIKGELFGDYVNKMYNLRQEYSKKHPMNLIAKLLNNSLYGKFGMKDEITKFEILDNVTPEDKAYIESIINLHKSDILDLIELDNYTMIIFKDIANISFNDKTEIYHGTEVNIAIASAITAYARVYMSQFKNNPLYKIYYSDTDSIVTNKPLSNDVIGVALGQVKLEHTIKKAVFLAPKVYALITENDEEVIKVKGLTKEVISKLSFNDLEGLLIKDSTREFNQEKWFTSIINAEITTSDMIYTLKATSSKREHIYVNGMFNNTIPYNYADIEIKSHSDIPLASGNRN
jgi:hypothetical protein